MKKNYLLSFLLISFLITSNVLADLVKGKWSFVKDKDYCYIGSLPTFLDIPEGKKEGKVIFLYTELTKTLMQLFKLILVIHTKKKNL